MIGYQYTYLLHDWHVIIWVLSNFEITHAIIPWITHNLAQFLLPIITNIIISFNKIGT